MEKPKLPKQEGKHIPKNARERMLAKYWYGRAVYDTWLELKWESEIKQTPAGEPPNNQTKNEEK